MHEINQVNHVVGIADKNDALRYLHHVPKNT